LESGFYEWPDVGRTINQFFELSADQYLHSPGKTLEIESTMEMFVPGTTEERERGKNVLRTICISSDSVENDPDANGRI
jgi:hypothetical protein